MRERGREGGKERERKQEKERKRERETHRQSEREKEREREREREREKERAREKERKRVCAIFVHRVHARLMCLYVCVRIYVCVRVCVCARAQMFTFSCLFVSEGSRETYYKTDSTQINLNKKSSENPRSTANQSSEPCTVLQYPSRETYYKTGHIRVVNLTQLFP